jgi:hypothetical protein
MFCNGSPKHVAKSDCHMTVSQQGEARAGLLRLGVWF